MNCCKCIEKKETQLIPLTNNTLYTSNTIYRNGITPIKTIQFSKIINHNKNTTFSLEEEDKNTSKRTYKYNDITQSNTNTKDISFKYTKINNQNSKYESIFQDLNFKTKINDVNLIEQNDDKKMKNECQNEENVNENISSFSGNRYYNTDFKKSKFNIYFKDFDNQKFVDKIKEDKSKIDDEGLTQSNIFPIKYNYQKEKYISYFTGDNK